MGFFDALMGRKKAAAPNLDALFAVPTAAITLEAELGIKPNGSGAVAFRAPTGRAFAEVQAELEALLAAPNADGSPGPSVSVVEDSYGFTWVDLDEHDDASALVTDLHAVNSTLKDNGFGPTLLCSVIGFQQPNGEPLGLVYLFKQGTFYPFIPLPGQQQRRDNLLEIQVRDVVGADLPFEPDLRRWFAVWGSPGLD